MCGMWSNESSQEHGMTLHWDGGREYKAMQHVFPGIKIVEYISVPDAQEHSAVTDRSSRKSDKPDGTLNI